MKKRRLSITIILLSILFLTTLISAEKLGIEILDNQENYSPGENINFKIDLYDDTNQKINGDISFSLINYYKDVIYQGVINSGEEVSFNLPENSIKGYWAIKANHNNLAIEELFNVLEFEKVEIRLEQDNLIITNLGNVPVVAKQISISIGNNEETALVSLDIGQEKKIRLTAPPGEYNIKVSDGTQENTFEVQGVSLTGNVIGLESGKNFFQENTIVSLFLVVLSLVAITIFGLRIYKKISKKKS